MIEFQNQKMRYEKNCSIFKFKFKKKNLFEQIELK